MTDGYLILTRKATKEHGRSHNSGRRLDGRATGFDGRSAPQCQFHRRNAGSQSGRTNRRGRRKISPRSGHRVARPAHAQLVAAVPDEGQGRDRTSAQAGPPPSVFDRGEVFGWRMSIQGSPERVLDSVLPHEITHMIFASHFRQPLPRWADEGGATSVEHVSERTKHQRMLDQFLRTGRGIAFSQMFAMTEYPSDVMPLYAQGYSLAEFLIQTGGRRKYIEFLDDGLKNNDWSGAVARNYGMGDLGQLQNTWLAWVKQGSPAIGPGNVQPGAGASPEMLAANSRGGRTELNSIYRQQGQNRPASPTMTPTGRLVPVPSSLFNSMTASNSPGAAPNNATAAPRGPLANALASASMRNAAASAPKTSAIGARRRATCIRFYRVACFQVEKGRVSRIDARRSGTDFHSSPILCRTVLCNSLAAVADLAAATGRSVPISSHPPARRRTAAPSHFAMERTVE